MASYYLHSDEAATMTRREGPWTLAQVQKAFATGRVLDQTLISCDEDPAVLSLAERPSLRAKMPHKAVASWSVDINMGGKAITPPKSTPRPPPPLQKRPTTPASSDSMGRYSYTSNRSSNNLDENEASNATTSQSTNVDVPVNVGTSNQDELEPLIHVHLRQDMRGDGDADVLSASSFKAPRGDAKGRTRRSFQSAPIDDKMQPAKHLANEDVLTPPGPPPLSFPFEYVTNLAQLPPTTHEATVVDCLSQRYVHDNVYTFVGKLLVSMNPFRPIQTLELVHDYTSPQARFDRPPHVYSIASAAFEAAWTSGKPQSIVISGESGSGKSEVTKLCMQYFSSMTRPTAVVSAGTVDLEAMLLACSPILDAFGNAKTTHNDNSSRFGKLLKLQLNDGGKIESCSITSYLLEKSRLTHVESNERNFHVLYQVAAALHPDHSFAYLAGASPMPDDVAAYDATLGALNALRFQGEETSDILSICSGILHLGNITFTDPLNPKNASPQSPIVLAAASFRCSVAALVERLTVRRLRVRGESMDMPLEGSQAVANRDALAKTLYSRLFEWLLRRINVTMQSAATDSDPSRPCILLVDIFGFEAYAKNGFEQLCINFANEKLQQLFHTVVFDEAVQRYRSEGLDVPQLLPVAFDVLELLEGKPKGIFILLDDEVSIPKASDTTLLSKIVAAHTKATVFQPASKSSTLMFTVVHYAQPVTYDCSDFLVKNKDYVAEDILDFLQHECMPLIQATASLRLVKAEATIGATFRKQLRELMALLHATDSHFIRCIKPNAFKLPCVVDRPYVLAQLRQMGIFKALAMHHGGLFPYQMSHRDFFQSNRTLARGVSIDEVASWKERCVALVQQFPQPTGFQIGNHSVFSSMEMFEWLSRARLAAQVARVAVDQCCRDLQTMVMTSSNDVSAMEACLTTAHHWTIEAKLQDMRDKAALMMRLRAKAPPYDIDIMAHDLSLCALWHLQDDPLAVAYRVLYHQQRRVHQVEHDIRSMLASKVIDIHGLESTLASYASTIDRLLVDQARGALAYIASTEGNVILELQLAVTQSAVDGAMLRSHFAKWNGDVVDQVVAALRHGHARSVGMNATLGICDELRKLRATLQTLTRGTASHGLTALKECINVNFLDDTHDMDDVVWQQWQDEVNLSREIVDNFDHVHKLLGKAWLSKVPQEHIFLNLCDRIEEVSAAFGIAFDTTVESEAFGMLAKIRSEKMFVVEVESTLTATPEYPRKAHIHIERLRYLGSLIPTPPLYDKTEIAADVCTFLCTLRHATKAMFESTSTAAVDSAYSHVEVILRQGHKQFDLLATDKWFRTIAYVLEAEQETAHTLVDLKRQSVRVAAHLKHAITANCKEWLVEGLDRVELFDLGRDYTIRDVVLRAKDAVQAIQNLRHELRHVRNLYEPFIPIGQTQCKAIDVVDPTILRSVLDKAIEYDPQLRLGLIRGCRRRLHSRLLKRATRLLKDIQKAQAAFAACQFVVIHPDKDTLRNSLGLFEITGNNFRRVHIRGSNMYSFHNFLCSVTQFDLTTDRLRDFGHVCAKLHFHCPERTRAEWLVTLSTEKFLQEQLKWALKDRGGVAHVLDITLAVKEIFFQRCGSSFDVSNFPRLRHKHVFAVSTDAPLGTSLTTLTSSENRIALHMSKHIFGYLGVLPTLYALRLGRELILTGLESRRLADEIYTQLVHQLLSCRSNSPPSRREDLCWDLVLLCVTTFPPSDGWWNYLEYFFRRRDKLALVRHLHQPKPPTVAPPTMETLFHRVSPKGIYVEGHVQLTMGSQKIKKAWLVLENSKLFYFKDESYRHDARAVLDIVSADDIQLASTGLVFTLHLPCRTKKNASWTLHFQSQVDQTEWYQAMQTAKLAHWQTALAAVTLTTAATAAQTS
ncbi:Aste57867_852 [Aphanomyces stellatus]|uniref:Aste57867_852 protein n=1 Tax=Aphanomyces stellatus TaxID=120398 RepID=A0A485K8R0_9STRA|nr:hypothetical protein As57867_000851 [Aphanomyces stellatus]VFT78076.1 Aste57867_852 [Aphanomyces stellatus]